MVIVFFTFHNVSINTIGRLRDGHLKQFALHSTMFLLIQRCSICLSYCYTTLHSTMFLLIPYFGIAAILPSSIFTFHNVSINTGIRSPEWCWCFRTLHSTMFLLIRWPAMTSWATVEVFTFHNVSINTSFQDDSFRADLRFTFHNVSINTKSRIWTDGSVHALHSTMFLLILLRLDSLHERLNTLYIPQCFY